MGLAPYQRFQKQKELLGKHGTAPLAMVLWIGRGQIDGNSITSARAPVFRPNARALAVNVPLPPHCKLSVSRHRRRQPNANPETGPVAGCCKARNRGPWFAGPGSARCPDGAVVPAAILRPADASDYRTGSAGRARRQAGRGAEDALAPLFFQRVQPESPWTQE
jgi:hypothetical protein